MLRRVARYQPDAAKAALPLDAISALLFVIISAAYFTNAAAQAASAPRWMDEVLSLWTARLPNVQSLWSALEHGAEFSPPLYDLLLHALIRAGISEPLGLRLPSILAVYLAALAMAVLVRRRASWPLAALSAGLVLSSGAFAYAVQARPYATVLAAIAWATVAWDSPLDEPLPRWRLAVLGGLLTLAVGLHFYAVLLVGALGLAEFTRAAAIGTRPRLGILLVVAIAIASIFLWWPIMQAASGYSRGEVLAPNYYGRPSLDRMLLTYRGLLGWLVLPLSVLALVVTVRGKRPFLAPEVGALSVILYAVPVGVLIFAWLVSHSYSDRYALAAVLGLALLTAWLALQLGRVAEPVAIVLLAAIAIVGIRTDRIDHRARLEVLRLVNSSPGDLPIATGDGLRFFELSENGMTHAARRLVFLDLPDVASSDPTNRRQVERWKMIQPDLRVVDGKAFVCATPDFLLLVDPYGGTDDLPKWLASHARFRSPPANRASLTFVHSEPCNAR